MENKNFTALHFMNSFNYLLLSSKNNEHNERVFSAALLFVRLIMLEMRYTSTELRVRTV